MLVCAHARVLTHTHTCAVRLLKDLGVFVTLEPPVSFENIEPFLVSSKRPLPAWFGVGKCSAFYVTDRGSKARIHEGGQRSTSGFIFWIRRSYELIIFS